MTSISQATATALPYSAFNLAMEEVLRDPTVVGLLG
jgi:hypothetical protein